MAKRPMPRSRCRLVGRRGSPGVALPKVSPLLAAATASAARTGSPYGAAPPPALATPGGHSGSCSAYGTTRGRVKSEVGEDPRAATVACAVWRCGCPLYCSHFGVLGGGGRAQPAARPACSERTRRAGHTDRIRAPTGRAPNSVSTFKCGSLCADCCGEKWRLLSSFQLS